MANSKHGLSSIHDDFEKLLLTPEAFVSIQDGAATKFKNLSKSLYDATKKFEGKANIPNDESLPELIVQNFDDEQIWQQLELSNNCLKSFFLEKISALTVKKDITFSSQMHLEEISENEVQDEEDEEEDADDEVVEKANKRFKIKRTTEVDDQFFKVDELEGFLKAEEDKEASDYEGGSDSSDDVDYFQDPDQDVGVDKSGRSAKYEDFFDPPHGDDDDQVGYDPDEGLDDMEMDNGEYDTRDYDPDDVQMDNGKQMLAASSSEDDNDENVKSNFEIRQERVNKKIAELEESNLADKPWQLKGEIAAGTRPENSLLQEHVQFDHTTRQAPEITEETTVTLEQLIKRRIKDQAWDDVVRKEKPKEDPHEYRKRLVLDQEKSKNSLAQIYEQEYLKEANKDKEEEEKESEEHVEIRKMIKSLFHKLDALANYHFTPSTAAPEIKIVNNMPAITVEQVAPSSVSDANLLAPQEVMKQLSGDLKGDSERTKEDKKHDRRKSKSKMRLRRKEKEKREKVISKMKPGLGNKYTKEAALKALEKLDSSTVLIKDDDKLNKPKMKSGSFFTQLQDLTTTNGVRKVKPKKMNTVSSNKVKL